MFKNQLLELAQRSCFNIPSYACVREGPDHAPLFKAAVNFSGEIFESPDFFSTLRQAEHAAAKVALNTRAQRAPSRTLASKVLDDNYEYKNLLQETAQSAGINLPIYTTLQSGPSHVPVFSSTVELVGMSFTGELAQTKKQAQKNAAMSAWYALKQMSQRDCSPSASTSIPEEQEQVVLARFLSTLKLPESRDCPQSNQPNANPNQPGGSRNRGAAAVPRVNAVVGATGASAISGKTNDLTASDRTALDGLTDEEWSELVGMWRSKQAEPHRLNVRMLNGNDTLATMQGTIRLSSYRSDA